MFEHVALGFETAFSFYNIGFCFVGVLLGTMIGVLPGLGPAATIAMLLPITLAMSPVTSLIMLAGIYYGAQYGGSTTAILINVPGESSSVVTALDGHQMARQGRAGTALAIAAVGSFVAGTISTFVIALSAPVLAEFALRFGPADYCALIVLGLVGAVVLASGSLLKSLAMVILGLLIGLVGMDVTSGTLRYTFGVLTLSDGLNFVAVAMGLFGVAEVIRNLEDNSTGERSLVTSKISRLMPSREDRRRSVAPILRGSAIGSVLGVLPGAGALLSSFASYAIEKKLSTHPEEFGHGAVEGVAGPEAANNAGAQSSFIPLLTLGIPANPVMALMIGAMMIQGIAPGPGILTDSPELFWGLIVSMWLGNLMLVVLNLPLIGIWVRLILVPYRALFPMILTFCSIGVYSISNSPFDVFVMAGAAFAGYAFAKLDCEPAPLLLGFLLGPLLEENFRRALLISGGDMMVFVERPISGILLALTVMALVVVIMPSIRSKRNEALHEEP